MDHISRVLSDLNVPPPKDEAHSPTNDKTPENDIFFLPSIDDLATNDPQPHEEKKTLPSPSPETPSSSIDADTKDTLISAIYTMKDTLDGMLRILQGERRVLFGMKRSDTGQIPVPHGGEKIMEGVFNGEKMIGPDGKEYTVPPNYASKSKLVEGDIMKLTITKHGSFIYKQIGPIERKLLRGELTHDSATGQWSVLAKGKLYKILTASVTFYKGVSGDDVTILVPNDGESEWGAVENMIRR